MDSRKPERCVTVASVMPGNRLEGADVAPSLALGAEARDAGKLRGWEPERRRDRFPPRPRDRPRRVRDALAPEPARIDPLSPAADPLAPVAALAPPAWSALPFALLLLAVALMPLVAHHWWESNVNRAKVTAALALPFAGWWLFSRGAAGAAQLGASLHEYAAFIALLGSLYAISGGIHIGGRLAGTPLVNTGLLAIGAVLANLIGTTGASMVLIRPLLRANADRHSRTHLVVFFIMIVSNTAGLLTPLGDPPLFLGFLHGVPFEWTLQLLPEWLAVNGLLLGLFAIVDRRTHARELKATPPAGWSPSRATSASFHVEQGPLRIEGAHNVLCLLGVALVTLAYGNGWGFADGRWPFGLSEGLMLAIALISWFTTRPTLRAVNQFSFAPMIEVAVIFFGIFVTMTAPLLLLNTHGSRLGLSEPWHYFWATGLISSMLDNAPTYLSFAVALAGQLGIGVESHGYLAEVLATSYGAERLAAISCGAVFMGALTYIGNGPNFMVKAIAETSGVTMPSFFGYLRWSFLILLPLFGAVTLLFFR